jgi:hypothetical protein
MKVLLLMFAAPPLPWSPLSSLHSSIHVSCMERSSHRSRAVGADEDAQITRAPSPPAVCFQKGLGGGSRQVLA